MSVNFRCDCPITSALDVLGDKWMLVIVKQMLLEGRRTFKDFTAGDESIATNILATKLKLLEEVGIVRKTKFPNNKKSNLYHLTDMGLSLAPIVVELALWSDGHLRPLNPIMRSDDAADFMRRDKAAFIEAIQKHYTEQLDAILNPE
ncbi:MAG: helix-turn-helix domain-containing protein [Bacteroidota bacterium]